VEASVGKISKTLSQKQTTYKSVGSMAQAVEHLSSKHKALSSNHCTAKIKKNLRLNHITVKAEIKKLDRDCFLALGSLHVILSVILYFIINNRFYLASR
jgi:hypothetical protein